MASMFSIITKNLFKKPATRLYPTEVRQPFERTRGRLYNDDSQCIYCGICQRQCPADAIKVDRPNSLWELNAYRCILCNECVTKCPKKCLVITNERRSCGDNRRIISLKREIAKPETPAAENKPAENK